MLKNYTTGVGVTQSPVFYGEEIIKNLDVYGEYKIMIKLPSSLKRNKSFKSFVEAISDIVLLFHIKAG